MAKVILSMTTAEEGEGKGVDVEGAEALMYPVVNEYKDGALVEALHPGKIVNALLELDLEDLVDVLHEFVPEMAVDAWIANIRRLKENPPTE
jgi:hypothetical protein